MRKAIKKSDIIIIGIILIAAATFYFINQFFFYEEGEYVLVSVDNKEVGRYSLEEDQSLIIHGIEDGTNTLVIKDGRAQIAEATCPDKLCVKQHWVDKSGESIICLPNKVIVKVISNSRNNNDPEIDAFTN